MNDQNSGCEWSEEFATDVHPFAEHWCEECGTQFCWNCASHDRDEFFCPNCGSDNWRDRP